MIISNLKKTMDPGTSSSPCQGTSSKSSADKALKLSDELKSQKSVKI